MIITLSLNFGLEYTVKLDKLDFDKTCKTADFKFAAYGNGINVSRILNQLDVPNVASGFLGRGSENILLRVLEAENININFVPINDNISLRLRVEDQETSKSFNIRVSETEITNQEIKRMFDHLERVSSKTEFVYMGGDLPKNVHKDIYAHFLGILNSKKIKCVLDTENEALLQGIIEKPYLVKPNLVELAELVEREKIMNLQQVKLAASEVVGSGTRHVVVSMGKDGAVWVNAEKIIHARPPLVLEKKVKGVGDAMVGGLMYGLWNNLDEETSLKYGIATATAYLKPDQTVDIKDYIENLYQKVEIVSVEENKYI